MTDFVYSFHRNAWFNGSGVVILDEDMPSELVTDQKGPMPVQTCDDLAYALMEEAHV